MNKTLLKFILPIAIIGSLSGCTNQGPSADEVLEKPFMTALMNATTGEWINDPDYSARLDSPAYLVYFQKVEVKGATVDISYQFDAKTKSKWKEGKVSTKEDDYRRKLIPTYNEDGTDLHSSLTLTATYKGKTKDVTYDILLLGKEIKSLTLKQMVSGSGEIGKYYKTKGIVTYIFPEGTRDGVVIADGDAALLLYDKTYAVESLYQDIHVGSILEVTGQLDNYKGLFELYPNKMAFLTNQGTLADPVAFDATIDAWKSESTMKANCSRIVNFENLQVTQAFKDAMNTFVGKTASAKGTTATGTLKAIDPEDETKTATINVVFNYHVGGEVADAIKAKVATLEVGEMIDVRGALVSYQSDPQISFISADNIVLLK